MIKNASFTFEEVRKKLEHYCSYQERCHKEVDQKLLQMNVIPLVREEVIFHLMKHDFLNEERFAQSFARGKFKIKKWGKIRIVRELQQRNITAYTVKSALNEINDEEYIDTFNLLAEKKYHTIKESNIYKKRKKLTDYLLYRGWESDLIYRKVQELIS